MRQVREDPWKKEILKKEGGLKEALEAYVLEEELLDVRRYGAGHINDTFGVSIRAESGREEKYILQRMNKSVFANPELLMSNMLSVTSYLKTAVRREGGDDKREVLTVLPNRFGGFWYQDSLREYWRLLRFVENTICLQMVERPEQFYEAGRSFGRFLRQLDGYPADTLTETIPHFHDTPRRFRAFQRALEQDPFGRASQAKREIQFILEREALCYPLQEARDTGALPLRVTHNDTKLNNILLDMITQKGVCIIDLDTIMPGLAAYDFGDSIRFGASTAEEDEQDLNKVHFDRGLYERYLDGYCQEAGSILTPAEYESLPQGAMVMTLECGMRFLTDFLLGDTYFKIHRPNHNLDRTRTQCRLLMEMQEQL